MKHFSFLAFILFSLLLSGCASKPYDSHQSAKLDPFNSKIVADNLVDLLATEYPPSSTQFAFSQKSGAFGEALEESLREAGYALIINPKDNEHSSLPLSYIFDKHTKNVFRGALKVAPSYELQRLYMLKDNSILKAKAVTVKDGKSTTTRKLEPPKPTVVIPPTAKKVDLSSYEKAEDDHDIEDLTALAKESYEDLNAKGNWAVQALAGTNLDDLYNHESKLKRLGLPAYVIRVDAVEDLNALRVGVYSSRAMAVEAQLVMKKNGYPDAFLTNEGGSYE